jgi:hypothetical protein
MMRLMIVIFSVLLLGLCGCGTSNNTEEIGSGELQITNESKQVDDFNVSINVENGEKNLNVYATITYVGEEAEVDIYHGGSIFFFNVYQQDGEFEYIGSMEQPLLTTTLIRNEPHSVHFKGIETLKLKQGTYKFEAIADFSLSSDDVVGTKIEIPVSKMKEFD